MESRIHVPVKNTGIQHLESRIHGMGFRIQDCLRVPSFDMIRIRISDLRSFGSWWIKWTDESLYRVDSSVHFKKRLEAIGWNSRYKKKTCDCLECKVLPSCKVWAQTDKNCKSYWPRLQFQVLCWPGVFSAIQDDEIHFLCYCPKYLKLRNEFFVQIKSHLHNFHELSYWDLVIKTINSKDMYLNYDWRLISHYWIICVTVYTVM